MAAVFDNMWPQAVRNSKREKSAHEPTVISAVQPKQTCAKQEQQCAFMIPANLHGKGPQWNEPLED